MTREDAVKSPELGSKDFVKVDLSGMDLSNLNFEGASLYGDDLRGANLYGANLYGADLRGANLRGANLRIADLYGANLRGANLRGANLHGADLRGADIDFACWPLWCGGLHVKIDKRIAAQLAYHFCNQDCGDPEYIKARNAILDFANQFHRVEGCGILGPIEAK